MRFMDLISDEEVMVFEGPKVAEFADMVQTAMPFLGLTREDVDRMRTATRITGTKNGTPTGRDWTADLPGAAGARIA